MSGALGQGQGQGQGVSSSESSDTESVADRARVRDLENGEGGFTWYNFLWLVFSLFFSYCCSAVLGSGGFWDGEDPTWVSRVRGKNRNRCGSPCATASALRSSS